MKIIDSLALSLLILLTYWSTIVCAQGTEDHDVIAVISRPGKDSIVLRWSPMDFNAWRTGIQEGYRVERFTIAKNDKIVDRPASKILAEKILPLPENSWERLVPSNKYAAVAAQALFGESFQMDITHGGIVQIVNQSEQNEQRFSVALFCADMSLHVARALGLSFTDKDVKAGEKYLYRLKTLGKKDTLIGSVFVGPDDDYLLPPPRNLVANFGDHLVSLQWDGDRMNHYTAYTIERSTDGTSFQSVSNLPSVMLAREQNVPENPHDYSVDSLFDNSTTFYYQVRGITPFGEFGPPSDTVAGHGMVAPDVVPYITSGRVELNHIIISWEYPQILSSHLLGFEVTRSGSPNGRFKVLASQLLPAESRVFTDDGPLQVNYYRVAAVPRYGQEMESPLYLSQMVDSIPPVAPDGLTALIDDSGTVDIHWHPNKEMDLFGYRVYRARYGSDEFTQLTVDPIQNTHFSDSINLNTLERSVYYTIMAIDVNQNHSALSETLKVNLPDRVRPQPPLCLPVDSDSSGVRISWIRSGSRDIEHYEVYRKSQAETDWLRIATVPASDADTMAIKDHDVNLSTRRVYTVIAIDSAGLESLPAEALQGVYISPRLPVAITWRSPEVLSGKNIVKIRWDLDYEGVASCRIYRKTAEQWMQLYKTVDSATHSISDDIHPGETRTYRIMAVFKDGRESAMSKELVVTY